MRRQRGASPDQRRHELHSQGRRLVFRPLFVGEGPGEKGRRRFVGVVLRQREDRIEVGKGSRDTGGFDDVDDRKLPGARGFDSLVL